MSDAQAAQTSGAREAEGQAGPAEDRERLQAPVQEHQRVPRQPGAMRLRQLKRRSVSSCRNFGELFVEATDQIWSTKFLNKPTKLSKILPFFNTKKVKGLLEFFSSSSIPNGGVKMGKKCTGMYRYNLISVQNFRKNK